MDDAAGAVVHRILLRLDPRDESPMFFAGTDGWITNTFATELM